MPTQGPLPFLQSAREARDLLKWAERNQCAPILLILLRRQLLRLRSRSRSRAEGPVGDDNQVGRRSNG